MLGLHLELATLQKELAVLNTIIGVVFSFFLLEALHPRWMSPTR